MAAINIRFPLVDDTSKNILFLQNGISKDALTSNLVLLLLTQKGERYYQPNYGTNLLKYIFEQKDENTINDIESELRSTVKEYIPQLTINKVSFYDNVGENGDKISDNQINIVIDFTFSEDVFSEEGTLTLTV
jgi:phage baseplate assembly protein W